MTTPIHTRLSMPLSLNTTSLFTTKPFSSSSSSSSSPSSTSSASLSSSSMSASSCDSKRSNFFSSSNPNSSSSLFSAPSRKCLLSSRRTRLRVYNEANGASMFGSSDDENTSQIPTQAQSLVEGSTTVLVPEFKAVPDVDYLQELLAIQRQGPRAIGFFGTRNMGFLHQELIEILSYAMVITKNHIFTSGASGTNAAVIRGALRAEKPELLTVILPQSLKKQPPESQELLSKVKNVIEKPYNDHLPLIEASRLCNRDIISQVQQVICFAFHDSKLLMETCQEAKNLRKIVTLFYLD
ncbi:hypothetical protein RJ641_036920 [Dillenia turbinata]|uniref:Uncharacterized protein n=1 Tax=Dillenia turbinata TaxID=194707 RepID=A0AAN8VQ79_9MAGN